MPEQPTSELARAIQDVTERAQLLVREEVALAKAEMTEKVTKLIKGAVFGIIAGVFAVFALIYLLHALSWGIWDLIGGERRLLARLPHHRRADPRARHHRRPAGHALHQARLAADAADGDRGGQADQGHADRRPGRHAGRAPVGARQAPGEVAR